ncbi:MAG: hypothetical protein LBR15_07630 [Methanobrevibacter sp.]|nr:hypothetical protein [Candidatus Methanovirga australis]
MIHEKKILIGENCSDEELDDLLEDVFEDDFDYNERIETNEELLVDKQEYKDLKDFYIKNYDLVKYLMDNQSSNMLNFIDWICINK